MKRVITSFQKANKDLLNAITKEFPKGVDDDVLVSYPKADGGTIRALEIIMDDCIYLVKMENHAFYQKYITPDEDDEDEFEEDDLDDSEEIDLDDED